MANGITEYTTPLSKQLAAPFGDPFGIAPTDAVIDDRGTYEFRDLNLLHFSDGGTVFADTVSHLSARPIRADGMRLDVNFLGEGILTDVWNVDIGADVIGRLTATDMRGLDLETEVMVKLNFEGDQSWFDLGAVFRAMIEGDENEIDAGKVFGFLRSTGDETDMTVTGGWGTVSSVGDETTTTVANFDGNVTAIGDETTTEVEESSGRIVVSGSDTSTWLEDFLGDIFVSGPDADADLYGVTGRVFVTGENASVSVHDSFLEQFVLGEGGFGHIHNSFVKGQVGEDTDLALIDAEAILTLAGGSDVHQSGGQSIFDAANDEVDEFFFTNGALVDGEFDARDTARLASGAKWEMGQLLAGDGIIELPGDVTIAGTTDLMVDDFAIA